MHACSSGECMCIHAHEHAVMVGDLLMSNDVYIATYVCRFKLII